MVQVPYYRPFIKKNDPRPTSHDIFQSIANEFEVDFIDFNVGENQLLLEASDFQQRIHPNKHGAAKVTKKLQELIEQ